MIDAIDERNMPGHQELDADTISRLWRQADAFPRKRQAAGPLTVRTPAKAEGRRSKGQAAIIEKQSRQILEPNEGAMRDLAVAVVLQAWVDLFGPNWMKTLDALLWLTGPDIPLWLDGLGMRGIDVLAYLAAGKIQKGQGLLRKFKGGAL